MIDLVTGALDVRRGMKPSWRRLCEVLVVVALAVTAFWYGRFGFLHTANPPDYYWMAPAVMVASGHGFTNPVPVKGSLLDDFLSSRRPALDMRDAVAPEIAPLPEADYAAMRYLLFTLGYWWKFTGIRWSALGDVAAALHVVAVLGVYATLRLFMPLLLSIAGALWMCTSTIQLSLTPHVRDYSKGAFILAVIPLILIVTLRARSRLATIAASAAAGALVGLGLGFKIDVAMMVPIGIACIVLFRGRRPWTDVAGKMQAIAALMGAVLVVGYPILSRLGAGGSNGPHVILLGFADQFDAALGITRPAYRALPEYDDSYIDTVVLARTERESGHWPARMISIEYDQVGRRVWTDLLRHFPADAFVRVLGATNSVLNLVFVNPAPVFTRAIPAGGILTGAYAWIRGGYGWGAALGIALVIVASLSAPRLGLLATFLLLALGGYPSLQFMLRHYFHLQMVPVFAVLAVITTAIRAPSWFRQNRFRPAIVSVAVTAVVFLFATVVPLVALRAYQSRHVDHLLSAFLDEPRTRLEPEYVRRPDGKWLVRWPHVAGTPSAIGPRAWAYYVVEFDAQDAQEAPAIGLRYRLSPAAAVCGRVLSVASQSGIARLGFEVFSFAGREFEGVEIEDRMKRRLLGIYKMSEEGPAGLPIELRLSSDWRRGPLYQRLQLEGDREDPGLEVKAAAPFRTCE